jgi:hypothetical protein
VMEHAEVSHRELELRLAVMQHRRSGKEAIRTMSSTYSSK